MKFRKRYVAEHPVVFWFSIGIALAGTIAVIAPETVEQSSSSLLLPVWLRTVFNLVFAVGGWMSMLGIAFGLRKLEASGMALLSTALLANFITIAYVAHIALV